MNIYLIGSLRNPNVIDITNQLNKAGHTVFSEWYGAGEKADDAFRDYNKAIGRSYLEALKTDAAKTIFNFDKKHIDASEAVVLVAPAGKSGHLELGYALGHGKKGYYLLDDPDRWDLMLQFATGIFLSVEDLVQELNNNDVARFPLAQRDCRNHQIILDSKDKLYHCKTCFEGMVPVTTDGKCIGCGRLLR